MALKGGGGRGRREEERNGEFRSPGSRNEETCVLGEPKRTTYLPLLQIFAEQAVCPRMHSSGPVVVSPCCFANSGWKGWKTSPAPPAPRYPGHPTCNSALSPNPHLTKVTYSLAFQVPRCGDLGGVGRGGGGVCRGGCRGTPKGEVRVPRASLRLLPVPRLSPSSAPRSPVSALVGRSRTLPPRRSPLQVSPRDPKP